MSGERNKQIVLEAYAALNSGDTAAYFARVADDVEWTSFGSHRFARTFHGKEAILKNLGTPLVERATKASARLGPSRIDPKATA